MQAEEASQDERREKAAKMKDAAAPGSGGSFGCQAQAVLPPRGYEIAQCILIHAPLRGQLEWL